MGTDAGRAAVRHAFLLRLWEDRSEGRELSLEEYQASFPGHEATIAEAHASTRPGCHGGRQEGPRRFGRFRLLQELGRGGQGIVYLAQDPRLERRVALKVLAPRFALDTQALERFRREAMAASRLDHPGICTVHELDWAEGRPFFVMAYRPGESLARRIASARRPPASEGEIHGVLALVEGAARAAHAAHEAGIVHRDLKPGNVLVTAEGQPVLLDFGLAHDEERSVALTLSGDVFGTPAYMAPEQIDTTRRADRRTDVYALGAILYECSTLARPFAATTREALYRAILHEDPPDPRRLNPALSRDVAAILATALAKEPENRYSSAADLADDLMRARLHETVRARPAGPVLRVRRWARRDPALAGTILGMLGVLVLGVAVTSSLAASTSRSLVSERRLVALRAAARLVRAEADLQRVLPEQLPAMDSWLAEAREVLGRDDLPVEEKRALGAALSGVERRRSEAAELRRRSIDAHREAWASAAAAVRVHAAYEGLELEPQLGLVPLGADLGSGLLEFAHLQTGVVPARAADGALEFTDETGLVFVLIPAGRFVMGLARPRGNSATEPEHTVALDAFFLSKYEMTQGQWLRMTGANPSFHRPGEEPDFAIRLTHPVENVSWYDCTKALETLGLELPTEAQWEYAARAGTRTLYWNGDAPSDVLAIANVADRSRERIDRDNQNASLEHDDGFPYHAPVGSFPANPFGLHDVHGNVWEFVREPAGSYARPVRAGDGQRAVEESGRRTLRGGSYVDPLHKLALHMRFNSMAPDARYSTQGVRPARALRRGARESP